jgi:8-oxo-dGTP diphosphatase
MPTISVVCALIVKENLVLLAQRPVGKHLAMKWEFPGGKVERGEAPERAILREIREELACEIDVLTSLPRSFHDYERGQVEMIPFVCQLTSNSDEPQACEHAALTWCTVEELDTFDLAPADLPIVHAWRDYRGS